MEEDAEILQEPEIVDHHKETVFCGYDRALAQRDKNQTKHQHGKSGSSEVTWMRSD